MAGDLVVLQRLPDHGGGRRKQAHGLLDHRTVPDQVAHARRTAVPAVRLGLQNVRYAAVAADQVQGPAQGPGRRLMSRQDEGQDVGGDLMIRQARTVAFLIPRVQQGGQQVVGGVAVGQAGAPSRHQGRHPLLEEARRPARGHAAQARDPVGRLQRIQRTDPRPDRQILVQRPFKPGGVAVQVVGEHGRRQDVEGQAAHLAVDVQHARAVVRQAPALDPAAADPIHDFRRSGRVGGREERRHDAALPPPLLALGQQQAVRQHGPQHPSLQVALHIVGGVVGQDMTHARRVADHQRPPQRRLAADVELLEVRLAPDLQRVAPALPQEGQQAHALGPARRRPGAEGRGGGVAHGALLLRPPNVGARAPARKG